MEETLGNITNGFSKKINKNTASKYRVRLNAHAGSRSMNQPLGN